MKIFYALIVLCAGSFIHSGQATGGSLVVELNGFRNDKGFVLMSLFNNEAGFPVSAEKAYFKEKGTVTNGKCLFSIPALPEGTYAIAVLHDENKNLKMDMKFVVLPKEGYGFSQDAGVVFGPPKFRKACFKHSGNQYIKITIRYM